MKFDPFDPPAPPPRAAAHRPVPAPRPHAPRTSCAKAFQGELFPDGAPTPLPPLLQKHGQQSLRKPVCALQREVLPELLRIDVLAVGVRKLPASCCWVRFNASKWGAA